MDPNTFYTTLQDAISNGNIDPDTEEPYEDDGSSYIKIEYTVTDDCPLDENGNYMETSGFSDSTCPDGFFCNSQDVFSSALSIQPCPLGYMLIDQSNGATTNYKHSMATTCEKTTEGYYVDHFTWALEPCPKGFYCPEGTFRSTQFPCPAGTY